MLDTKGISIKEIQYRFPPQTQILGYDVLMDVDEFHKPKVIDTFDMIINSIITLLVMKPGQYPSIPELGIDVEQYLFEYSDDKSIPSKIITQLYDQCNLIQATGIEIDCFISHTTPSKHELCVQIKGTDYVTFGHDSPVAIIGISYDKLNKLYLKRYQNLER